MSQTATATDARPLLSPREVAAIAGVSVKTIYRQVDLGALPALRAGRQLRIDPYDFRHWLETDKGMR